MHDYVILAAGKGTRLWPVTARTPKAMVRVLNKPIIEWLVEGIAKDAGKIVVVVGSDGDIIKKHFSAKPYFKKMVFALQREQLGTGHAVLAAEKFVKGSFVVLNADTFVGKDFAAMVAKHAAKGAPFIVAKQVEDVSAYGTIVGKSEMLKEIREKEGNAQPGSINTGCYFANKDFFDFLGKTKRSERGEIEATQALSEYAAKKQVQIVEYTGYWNDVGYYWNYLDSSRYALDNLLEEKVEGTVENNVSIKGKVFIAKGALVKSGTYIEGPAFIGEGAIVGPNAFIREGTVLEGGNHVGNASEIKNSILGKGSNAPHLSYVADSILCDDVNLGGGTLVANLKFDETPVEPEIKGQKVSSKKRKLGCVIGQGTRIGINVSINCGVMIGENCRIFPHSVVLKNLESGSTYKGENRT